MAVEPIAITRPGPVAGRRIVALDILRGLAVFGILVVNVEQLFIPTYLANAPVSLRPEAPGAMVAWFITDAFFESKFLTIFSLLFGAGFCLQWMRYRDAPGAFTRLYLRRILVLIAFGVLHAVFFYFADVLVLYGLTALLLLLFRNRSARAMIRTGTVMLLVMTLWHILLSGPEPDAARHHQAIIRNLGDIRSGAPVALGEQVYAPPVPNAVVASHLNGSIHSVDEATAQALAFGRGPARLAVRARLVLFAKFITLFTPLFLLWRTLGLFLIAAGMVKRGWLDPLNRAKWKRTALVGFVVGLPLTLAGSALRLVAYEHPGALTFAGSALHDVSALFLAAGIGALVLMIDSGGAPGGTARAIASVGRLALTNYIGQSVVMTLLATSIGLAWFGRIGRMEMLLLCVPVFAAQIAASLLWTRYFRLGPLEWIWRAATYGAFPPVRLAATPTSRPDRAGR